MYSNIQHPLIFDCECLMATQHSNYMITVLWLKHHVNDNNVVTVLRGGKFLNCLWH